MVKGIARRVIVVKSPDPKLFEQAIFIMREDAAARGVSADQVLQEAQRVANGYIRRNTGLGRYLRQIPPVAYAALGALLATALWSLALLMPF